MVNDNADNSDNDNNSNNINNDNSGDDKIVTKAIQIKFCIANPRNIL